MLHWEEINHDNGFYLRRAKVFGGWLVVAISDVQTLQSEGLGSFSRLDGVEWRSSLTYIPDPEHRWEIDQKPI